MITKLAHATFGILTSLISIISPILPFINLIIFTVYELDEEWHLEDESYKDILEFAVGLAIGEIILLIYHLIL
jgi:p-aminobenzoyl-glutamate transporter AbgT